MKNVVVLIPTLGRPHHIEPLLQSLYESTSDARPLFLTTPTDREVRKVIDATGEERIDVPEFPKGDYARKINTGYLNSKEPLLFLAATDLKFGENWLDIAVSYLDKKIQVVGTNDLGNPRVIRGNHSTHTLVTRKYCDTYGTIDRKGKVLHEGYPHEYVDDEFVETAKVREAFAMAKDSIVEHLHPTWGKGEWDESYRQVDERLRLGYRHFCKRSKLWTQR